MSRASVLARGRAFAAGGFVDTCVIRRVVDVDTNDLYATETPQYAAVYSGPCRVQLSPTSPSGGRVEVGDNSVVVYGVLLQLPVTTSPGVQRGDEVVINTAANDSDLLVGTYHVETLGTKTHATARRLGLIRAT
jgi:hypothetical protein